MRQRSINSHGIVKPWKDKQKLLKKFFCKEKVVKGPAEGPEFRT